MQVDPIHCVIICRDRVTHLNKLVSWLEHTPHKIVLLDNGSTYPPLLEYYEHSPHQIVRLGLNIGQHSPWHSKFLDTLDEEFFMVSDPDIVPTEECPYDAIEFLIRGLQTHTDHRKAGLSLKIDDVPLNYGQYEFMKRHEGNGGPGDVEVGEHFWHKPIDTTFAVMRKGTPYTFSEGMRAKPPYSARHMEWYRIGPDPEYDYYWSHAIQGVVHY